MINAVENVIAQVPADVKVIPGHGQVSSLDDLQAHLTILKATRDAIALALKDGEALDQMKQASIPIDIGFSARAETGVNRPLRRTTTWRSWKVRSPSIVRAPALRSSRP
jgi:hypothetical protein